MSNTEDESLIKRVMGSVEQRDISLNKINGMIDSTQSRHFKFQSKFGFGSVVTYFLGKNTIRHCSVCAVKFEERLTRYDILVDNVRVYDVLEECLEGIEQQPLRSAEGELM